MIMILPLEKECHIRNNRQIIRVHVDFELRLKIELFSCRNRALSVSLPVMLFTCAALSNNPLLGSEMLANRIPANRAISSVGFCCWHSVSY
jgi:hypothetical protein